MSRLLLTALALPCLLPGSVAGGEAAADGKAPPSLTVPLDLIVPPAADAIVGGAGDQRPILRFNLPLLRRLLLDRSDLRAATLELSASPNIRNMAVVRRSRVANGAAADLADCPELQAIALRAGGKLALTLWRHAWHWHGGGQFTGLSVSRLAPGQAPTRVAVPAMSEAPRATTPIGTFELVGYGNRDRFPQVGKRVPVERAEKPGVWTVPGARGFSIASEKGTLKFHTNGRAKWGKEYDWAPMLVFTPAQEGTYRIGGKLAIYSAGPGTDANISWAVVRIPQGGKQPLAGATFALHRILRPGGEKGPAGGGYAAEPIASAGLDHAAKGKLSLSGLAEPLQRWLAGEWPDHGVVAAVSGADGALPRLELSKRFRASVTIRQRPAAQVFEQPLRPVDGTYVQARGSRLTYGDRRLRMWGVAGGIGNDPGAAGRIARLGFNAIRLWGRGGQASAGSPYYDDESGPRGRFRSPPKAPGQRDLLDDYDRYFAACRNAGLFVMCPMLMNRIGEKHLLEDDSFVAGGEDWQEWKKAIQHKNVKARRFWLAFDERLIKAQKQHMKNVLDHVNPHTGKRYAEEEAVAIWEIHNEHGLLRNLLEQGIDTWPQYFRAKLRRRWNATLKARYGNHAALAEAWGKLPDGESLDGGTVALAPVLSQRTQFPARRAEDFLRFLTTLVSDYYGELKDFCRAQAPEGRGVRVVPFSYDTQYRPCLPWHFSAGGQADTSTFGMYFFTLTSGLTAPPAFYVMDSQTVAGKPTVIYETNAGRPNPFRGELPLRIAAFASWQDWDAVFWHYYHSSFGGDDETYLVKAMPYISRSHYWTCVETERDPLMLSCLAMAGRMFLGGGVAPAPHPVTYRVGKQALFSYRRFHGVATRRAAFETGAAIRFEPDADIDVQLEGADEARFAAPPKPPLRSGDQIVWDWAKGRLVIDAPAVKVYVGPTDGNCRFRDGIVVGGFSTGWAAFVMASADGRPLTGPNATRRIFLNARLDAKNTGFAMDASAAPPDGGFVPPLEQAAKIRSAGHAPVLEDAVAYTVWLPRTVRGLWQGYDFALRRIVQRPVRETNRLVHDGTPLFMSVLDIESRGEAAETPAAAPLSPAPARAPSPGPTARARAHEALKKLWHPLSNLHWSDGYEEARTALQESKTAIRPIASPDPATRLIRLAETDALFASPANIDLLFRDGRMQRVEATFTRPPALKEVVTAYEKQFGKPAEKSIAEAAYATSRVRWTLKSGEAALHVTATETQGNLRIVFEPRTPLP